MARPAGWAQGTGDQVKMKTALRTCRSPSRLPSPASLLCRRDEWQELMPWLLAFLPMTFRDARRTRNCCEENHDGPVCKGRSFVRNGIAQGRRGSCTSSASNGVSGNIC
ncbi:unnamed protein product [Durusdinium trenchii]|uniref:Uncharacterized protein n=2 Tax=Durusdinium trenchii TaxID=1381693 RepID=A0ABP0NP20_9DINO